jgi:hypothetical protein
MAYPPPNPFGPVPLASLGFIAMQPIAVFQASNNPQFSVSADGRFLVYSDTTSARVALDQDGTKITLPIPPAVPNGYVCGLWATGGNKIQVSHAETAPTGFVTGNSDFDTGNANFLNVFRQYDRQGSLEATVYSVPNSMPSPPYAYDGQLDARWFNDPFATNNLDISAACLKLDDIDTPNGIYYSLPMEYNAPNLSQFINTVRINSDISKSQTEILDLYINGFDEAGYISYKRGIAWTGLYYADFQSGAYEANFPSNILYGAGIVSTDFRLAGINCLSQAYYDTAIGRALPVRMAQDQYLYALAACQNGSQPRIGNGPRCLPTRLLNSAAYAQALWQPGLAINESMLQYGITSEYPELQLANVGFFDGSNVRYYNVLPQDFLKYDITQSPDLLWVSPAGYVLAVYHDNSGNYYFMVGGSRVTYQTQVYNYRYGFNGS